MKLNAKQVAALRDPGRYGDGQGLYLQITPTGSRSWCLRYERNGKETMLGLGPLSLVGLADARVRAQRARLSLLDGADPLAERRANKVQKAAPTMTFAKAAETYYNDHAAKWHAQHRFLISLQQYAFPVFGTKDVASITTEDVLKVVQPLWLTKNETMRKTLRRVETVLSWATAKGFRTNKDNPAQWKGRLAVILPASAAITKVRHHPALPYAELPAFMVELRQQAGIAARALELTILTATRTGETLGARWAEIDLEAGVWVVPGERTKTRSPLRVALSEPAINLLRSLPREDNNPYCFLGRFAGANLSDNAMAVVTRSLRPGITTHGFRSTFKDWASEVSGHDNIVSEQALGHAVGNAVERAYRRGDLFEKRKKLMADWAAYCDGAAVAGNVVPMVRAVAQ